MEDNNKKKNAHRKKQSQGKRPVKRPRVEKVDALDEEFDAIEEEESIPVSQWIKIAIMIVIIIVLVICLVFILRDNGTNNAAEKNTVSGSVSTENTSVTEPETESETETQNEDVYLEGTDLNNTSDGNSNSSNQMNTDGTNTGNTTQQTNTVNGIKFNDANEPVTAKDKTNLRNVPSQGTDSTVVGTLNNGETLTRTGYSDGGWSRLDYNGQAVYAVSSYLTTDIAYAPQANVEGTGDGLKTKFADCSDTITAKIEVNLRLLPSVTNPDASVAAVLHNGETITRTGVNDEYGWSRVDYNGQTLYCITSYVTSVQQ